MSSKLAFVIEDDFDGSMVFAKALEANGLAPEQIMTGNLAIEKLAKEVPTLVVLDLHLPAVPGPEILKAIRADARLAETLVVVVTADPRMADVIREDADLVLLKPTTFSQVRDLVGRLMAVRERNTKAPEPAEPVAEAPASPVAAAAAEAPKSPAAEKAADAPEAKPSAAPETAAKTVEAGPSAPQTAAKPAEAGEVTPETAVKPAAAASPAPPAAKAAAAPPAKPPAASPSKAS